MPSDRKLLLMINDSESLQRAVLAKIQNFMPHSSKISFFSGDFESANASNFSL